MTPLKTNILIAGDHSIVLNGLRTVLNAQPDLEVVMQATDGAIRGRASGEPRHLDAAADELVLELPAGWIAEAHDGAEPGDAVAGARSVDDGGEATSRSS